jgi:hypothetical protein
MDCNNDIVKDRSKKAPVMLFRAILGIVLGGLAGFALYRYVGCADGTCLISSSPWGSIVYWMILGFVLSQARWPNRVTDCCRANRDLSNADTQQPQKKELDL